MWEWIGNILNTKTDFTNYDYLLATLRNTLNDNKKTHEIIEKYFNNINSTENVLNKVKEKK